MAIITEYAYADEAYARNVRRIFIDRGAQVSLIAFDPERGLHAFNIYPDEHGNVYAREGLDRCWCGVKYWENDKCVDCGTHVLEALEEAS